MLIPTKEEHWDALDACQLLRQAFPNNPTTTTIGTIENDVNKCLSLLNELAGAHACNESMNFSHYQKCLNAINDAKRLADIPPNTPIPKYTVRYIREHFAIATTETGKRYTLMKRDNGWQRGIYRGKTIDDVMRGAK